jgi:hypothetical protein
MTNEEEHDDALSPQPQRRRKLRVLILSMGGERRRILEDLFASSVVSESWEPPTFCPGVPSRELRTRALLWQHLKSAGILPPAEWEFVEEYEHHHPQKDEDAYSQVPIDPLRRGNAQDVAVPYAVEFWRKAKTINRGRSVLACALAHLRALRQLTHEHFDVLLEDNVRFAVRDVAQRIWDCIDATTANSETTATPCHMRYYGWLGSQPNVHWIYSTYIPRCNEQRDQPAIMVPCPIPSDIVDPATTTSSSSKTKDLSQPGGSNPVWGAYAYWISPQAYQVLIETLQRDVGALLWKSKRMRYYQVKPIDKVIPRILRAHFDNDPACIQIPVRPAFFRAPMLTSQIHTQWDAAFCRSTTDQLQWSGGGLQWTDLGLTETEQRVVAHARSTDWTEWCTPVQLLTLPAKNPSDDISVSMG